MSIPPKVKSGDAQVKAQREATAQRVMGHFGLCLPESRLLCFLDDEDPSVLRESLGLQIAVSTDLFTTTLTWADGRNTLRIVSAIETALALVLEISTTSFICMAQVASMRWG
jgi:hypothetical protein